MEFSIRVPKVELDRRISELTGSIVRLQTLIRQQYRGRDDIVTRTIAECLDDANEQILYAIHECFMVIKEK